MKLILNVRTFFNNAEKIVNIAYDSHIIEISESTISGDFDSVIDAKGALLIPGGIDAHVHFNDPGFQHHEDFTSGTQSAAAGGITTIIDMPCTSVPAVTSATNLQTKVAAIQSKAVVDYAFWGGISGNDIDDKQISELWDNGVVGFKIYTISGMDSFSALSYEQIGTLLHERPQYLYAFHAEDSIVIEKNLKNKQVSVENYAEIRSVEAEYQAVKAILDFATLKNRLHFVHISSQKAAELIIKKKIKHSISWETCPHYLQFTKKDFPVLRGKLKTAPPVKSEEDRTFLREQLINGNLDFVATDHAGCDYSTEKDMTDFAKIYNGIPGTQLMLPYLISEFYNKNKISLAQLIQLTSENAAKRYGLYPQKGSLEISSDADFTIIDCNDFYIVDEKKLLCKGNYSPFHGLSFSASILLTILRGNPVFSKQNGMIASPGIGKLLRRKNIEPD